ncbi:MAG: hypothetical protein II922_11225 [Succinimonas sp.]|nr:hypothetical protein [Succinimonas sp.]
MPGEILRPFRKPRRNSGEDAEACCRLGFYYEHAPDLSPQERRDRALEIYGELCRKRDPQGCEGFRRIKNAFAR